MVIQANPKDPDCLCEQCTCGVVVANDGSVRDPDWKASPHANKRGRAWFNDKCECMRMMPFGDCDCEICHADEEE